MQPELDVAKLFRCEAACIDRVRRDMRKVDGSDQSVIAMEDIDAAIAPLAPPKTGWGARGAPSDTTCTAFEVAARLAILGVDPDRYLNHLSGLVKAGHTVDTLARLVDVHLDATQTTVSYRRASYRYDAMTAIVQASNHAKPAVLTAAGDPYIPVIAKVALVVFLTLALSWVSIRFDSPMM